MKLKRKKIITKVIESKFHNLMDIVVTEENTDVLPEYQPAEL